MTPAEFRRCYASPRNADANQVIGCRRRFRERVHLRFILAIDAGQSVSVLPQVLLPGWHHEELDKSVRRLPIAEEAPLGCPGSQPRLAKVRNSFQELCLLVGCDG